MTFMKLPAVRGSYRENYNLAHLTWFKVGGAADVLYKPFDEDDIEMLGEFVRRKVMEHSGIELKWEIKRIGRNGKI